jgi:hypothetical protein
MNFFKKRLVIKYPIIIVYASILNLVWGILLYFDPGAGHTSTLNDLSHILGQNICYTLLGFGLLALLPIIHPLPVIFSLILLLPQELTIFISLVTALTAMFNAQFADGVIRSHSFIIADQFPAVLIAILYTYSLFENFRNPELL